MEKGGGGDSKILIAKYSKFDTYIPYQNITPEFEYSSLDILANHVILMLMSLQSLLLMIVCC